MSAKKHSVLLETKAYYHAHTSDGTRSAVSVSTTQIYFDTVEARDAFHKSVESDSKSGAGVIRISTILE